MQDSEADAKPDREGRERLVLHDRGPWVFCLYWYSFTFQVGDGPPQKAMRMFGLSPELRAILGGNSATAPLAKRLDARLHTLMVACLAPGFICIAPFVVLYILADQWASALQGQYLMLGAVLAALAFLSLVLLTIFTRDVYRSFKELFDVYNATDKPAASG
jgi:hypothetical protein